MCLLGHFPLSFAFQYLGCQATILFFLWSPLVGGLFHCLHSYHPQACQYTFGRNQDHEFSTSLTQGISMEIFKIHVYTHSLRRTSPKQPSCNLILEEDRWWLFTLPHATCIFENPNRKHFQKQPWTWVGGLVVPMTYSSAVQIWDLKVFSDISST